MATQNIIRKGCKWQVGNGVSIDIWVDKWLNGPATFSVLTRSNTLLDQSLVRLLIDPVTGGWRDELVRQVFLLADVHSIPSIPLSVRMPWDKLVWAFTSKGNFTIRSAYKIAVADSMVTRMEGTSNGEDHITFWRRLWSLNVLNKIKSFAWQVCRNIIPTKVNLCHRQVIDDDMCEACGLGKETSGHIFWECEAAHEVWVQSGIIFETQGVRYNEFVNLVWYLIFIQHVGNDFLEMLFMIAWSMWHNRNAA